MQQVSLGYVEYPMFSNHPSVIQQHLAWCSAVGHREASIDLRGQVLARFSSTLAVGLEHALASHIEDWLAGLDVSNSSRRTYLKQLRGFYRWALDHELVVRDPTARVPLPREPKRIARPAPWEEIEVAARMAPEPVSAWIVLGAWAGLRCCEIALVRGEHLNGTALEVPCGKGGDPRHVSLHWRVAQVLADYPSSGRLWLADARTVSRRGAMWLRRAGVNATMHQLRHSFATGTYAEQGDLFAVQQLLGHANPATTAQYVRIEPARLAAAVAALP
jgi:integrase/recombinase XerC